MDLINQIFLESPIQEDPLIYSRHDENDTLSKAADVFYNKKDYDTARKLYELASMDNNGFRENGSTYAKLKLAYMFHHLRMPNMELAIRFYTEAYQCGCIEAGNNIGCIHFNGTSLPKNLTLAFQYFLEAANKGNMYAQYNLARCYKKGFGVNQDLLEALNWYTKSADQGFELAKTRVFWLNQKGYFADRKVDKRATVTAKRTALVKRKGASQPLSGTLEKQANFIANL